MEPIQKGANELAAKEQSGEPFDVDLRATAEEGAAELIKIIPKPELLARGRPLRVAFKAKGKILLLDLAEILAVHAEGDHVSLEHNRSRCLLRGSLSSIGETLKPYGFIRIHRSVIVNATLVEEIQPLSTGEYKLRVRGGKEYTVTRTYRDNLRSLAHLWLGPSVFAPDCR